ncbi:XPA protein C-terminus-domain-containing protein [Protomyces lactucae-debilis]|uniref:DNA repair protein RAD14 n=1 Tax=Protomyces lactucae-debilis TaxID=2754530 RepID=A0A1Y2FJ77_PROLT|nr:XPA protein C-terminus-domain-containing protein [Protomyces lactucae-debilis]ORY83657.1 XPA protein C-terminus-domain-containing protein [Protomyces lactucae-debilis]
MDAEGRLAPVAPPAEPIQAQQRNGATAAAKRREAVGTIVQSSYIEYDFSKMKDSKAGFMVDEATGDAQQEDRAAQLQRLRDEAKRYDPPLALDDGSGTTKQARCFECNTVELDFQFFNVFKARVCHTCKNKLPDKYSLLTKTECKQDYLLTDPELRDVELMPHLLKPNPHNTTYSSMMLYLRYQVEEFAYKKWGSPEKLDEEFERRTEEKKVKKDKAFELKLKELRKRTRVAKFSKSASRRLEAKHEHVFGAEVEDPTTGMTVRTCAECGLESEELVM